MTRLRIYIASSWRNPFYVETVKQFRDAGHYVWDWRNPPTGGCGFGWSDCGGKYKQGDLITALEWARLLNHETAQRGFASDLCGMNWCDEGYLLHPCGKSAHLEAGWIAGRGKKVHVICPVDVEPDLMVLALNGKIYSSISEAVVCSKL